MPQQHHTLPPLSEQLQSVINEGWEQEVLAHLVRRRRGRREVREQGGESVVGAHDRHDGDRIAAGREHHLLGRDLTAGRVELEATRMAA